MLSPRYHAIAAGVWAWALGGPPGAVAGGDALPEAPPTDAEIGEVHVYLTPEKALGEIFAGVARVDTVIGRFDAVELETLRRTLGVAAVDSLVVFRPHDRAGVPLGYAVVGEEIGKYRPITFMVGTDLERRILGVEILVYRESRGAEVRRERFLRQYRGKDSASPLRTHQDILNIAGATLSVHALNHGVKRVLLGLEALAHRGVL